MGNSFQIGKIFGISIRIDYTWFVIFALVSLSLGGNYFPQNYPEWLQQYPRWSSALYWFMGIITALVLFSSVLAHELAHSLVSRARGVPVDSITLFIFGGVARLSDEPKSPGGEFWMALAGPATSIVIGIISRILFLVTGSARTPLAAFALWLSHINLAVAVFNLVPGFPLDGGRIFRSIVWRITGNLRKATRIASTAGRILAYLLILRGITWLLSGALLPGVWIAFIGWFLEKAASSSYRQLEMREMLQGVKVRDAMVSDCVRLPSGMAVREFVESYILHTTHRCFPVADGENILGVLAVASIRAIPREQWDNLRVEEVMVPFDELGTVHPDDELFIAMQKIAEERVEQLPVVENGQLMGMIARDNLVDFMHSR